MVALPQGNHHLEKWLAFPFRVVSRKFRVRLAAPLSQANITYGLQFLKNHSWVPLKSPSLFLFLLKPHSVSPAFICCELLSDFSGLRCVWVLSSFPSCLQIFAQEVSFEDNAFFLFFCSLFTYLPLLPGEDPGAPVLLLLRLAHVSSEHEVLPYHGILPLYGLDYLLVHIPARCYTL
jgi:hypothetical protein